MCKVVAMGETILDILFKERRPVAAVPGGSSFNAAISIGRSGLPVTFVGYTGDDYVGDQISDFLVANGVGTDYFTRHAGEKSAVSLAYLSATGDAHYVFHKPAPRLTGEERAPRLEAGDVLLFGSYFALAAATRPFVELMLRRARAVGATVYYDVNFRESHRHEFQALVPALCANYASSTIVRGSADDFRIMYASDDARAIYEGYLRREGVGAFILTSGAGAITVATPTETFRFDAPRVDDVVSTVGAGDNFNAGLLCALLQSGTTREDIARLTRSEWQRLVASGTAYAAQVCRTEENYIPTRL